MKLLNLQEADEQQGVDEEKLVAAWKSAGGPSTPQEMVDFLHANVPNLSGSQVAAIFKQGAGLALQQADDENQQESLTSDSVENIKVFLNSLTVQELEDFMRQVRGTQVMTKNQLARSDAAAGAAR